MSTHTLITLADALVTELNVTSRFSLELTAVRSYQPVFDLKDLSTLKASVVFRTEDTERATRGSVWQREYVVDMVIQKKVANMLAATLDPLMNLAGEIAEWFRDDDNKRPLPSLPQFVTMSVANDPAYSQELLEGPGIFASQVAITLREWR